VIVSIKVSNPKVSNMIETVSSINNWFSLTKFIMRDGLAFFV